MAQPNSATINNADPHHVIWMEKREAKFCNVDWNFTESVIRQKLNFELKKNSKIVSLIQIKQMNRIKMSVNFILWQLDLSEQKVISGIKCWNLIKYQIEILFFNWLNDGFHRKQVVGKFSIPKFSTIRSHMFVNMTHAALFWQDEIPAIKVITCKWWVCFELQYAAPYTYTYYRHCAIHSHSYTPHRYNGLVQYYYESVHSICA